MPAASSHVRTCFADGLAPPSALGVCEKLGPPVKLKNSMPVKPTDPAKSMTSRHPLGRVGYFVLSPTSIARALYAISARRARGIATFALSTPFASVARATAPLRAPLPSVNAAAAPAATPSRSRRERLSLRLCPFDIGFSVSGITQYCDRGVGMA